jgi:hypothetical protein
MFNVESVSRIAQEAAHEQSRMVKVAGVVLSAGGSDYVEVLITIESCRPILVSSRLAFSEMRPRLN